MRPLFIISFFLLTQHSIAQNVLKARILDEESKEPLIGATAQLKDTSNGGATDTTGFVLISNIPDGRQTFYFSYVGYGSKIEEFIFPLAGETIVTIYLKSSSEELEEVIVESTRSSRAIKDIPTRIEAITASELDEKANMQPSNVRMLLTESTGIQTQQTSATSANASIRIQGLDGKYTQLLQNGFPLYSGFSSGLSVLQIPPLDLKRVEVIKGSSSTLYGGGAIAGLINFVTKEPTENRELSFLFNVNQTKALDASGYYGQKFKKIGITFFTSSNSQAAYDANKDGLSDIPQFQRYTFNPHIIYYANSSTKISFGLNSGFENRLGGDMTLINSKADSTHSYFERNKTNRISSQLKAEKKYSNNAALTFKNSFSFFDRSITKPTYQFSGNQLSSYSELSYSKSNDKTEWVLGSNLWTENFIQRNVTAYKLSNSYWIAGGFVQNHTKLGEKIIMENGLRLDYTSINKLFALPRISMMYKFSPKLTGRVTGGLGYKMPTIFSEDAEEKAFQNIEPLRASAKAETSYGGNFDFNFKTSIGDEITLSLNQLFFYTRLNDPLILSNALLPNGNLPFLNANGFIDTKGFETNLKVEFDDISLYIGYTFIDAKTHYDNVLKVNPLTAKNRLYSTLMYEIEGKLRVAYELFYIGEQALSSGEQTPSYWIMGISAERKWKHFSLFANAENFLDARQSRFQSMNTGTIQNPSFRQIWAPTDGFIYNGGIKILL